jgi:hypothetical protein
MRFFDEGQQHVGGRAAIARQADRLADVKVLIDLMLCYVVEHANNLTLTSAIFCDIIYIVN